MCLFSSDSSTCGITSFALTIALCHQRINIAVLERSNRVIADTGPGRRIRLSRVQFQERAQVATANPRLDVPRSPATAIYCASSQLRHRQSTIMWQFYINLRRRVT